MNVQSPPSVPPQAPKKKGLPALAWVGIGCGAIILIGAIVVGAGLYMVKKKVEKFAENPGMAAAELVIKANPDLELVSKDDKAKTFTVRDKKSGETMTVNLDDIENGKIAFETSKGKATIDTSGGEGGTVNVTGEDGKNSSATFGGGAPEDLPSWVPVYPGGTARGSFDTRSDGQRTAAFSVTTQDSVSDVLAFYEGKLQDAGLKVSKTTFDSTDSGKGGIVTGTTDDDSRSINVTVSSTDEGSQVAVTFTSKS